MAWADAVDADAWGAIVPRSTPLHGQVTGELDERSLGGVVDGREHAFVCNKAGHAGDKADTATTLVFEHHLGGARGRLHSGRVIGREHLAGISCCVLDGRCDLEDARRGNDTIQLFMFVGNLLDGSVEFVSIKNILLAVD